MGLMDFDYGPPKFATNDDDFVNYVLRMSKAFGSSAVVMLSIFNSC